MEFLHANNDPDARIDAIRVNWYYRPKDIQRRVQDTRVVFASMHSDTCPLTSVRGKCNIQHLSEIENLDHYRVQKDSFWFDKLYDRYMHRYYEVIPTSKVINVPQHVKKVLDERWKFVLVEIGRGRELTSAVKTCRKCSQYAANHDSVDCAVCKFTYHMACIRPPLTKKPARGFAWACAACSRAQELLLQARNTPTLTDPGAAPEDEALEEEDEDVTGRDQMTRESSMAPEPHPSATAAQIAQANLWPYRYLGIHCRVEDALDYDDRIYPRASSRLGPRHQANVNVWHGRPVELVKPADIRRKYLKNNNHKKDAKVPKETVAAIEAEKDSKSKRPKWVVDEPFGYVPRGEDEPVEIRGKKEHTAQLIFRMPDSSDLPTRGDDSSDEVAPENREKLVDEYMHKAKAIAPQYGLEAFSVDFLTKAVEKLREHKYDAEAALAALKQLNLRSDLKQPDLNREEVRRFEEGVSKYGSELHNVARHVGPNMESRVVRFYYMWKKTERGRQIWGNYEGRRSKKESKRVEKDGTGMKLLDDIANDQDDSAFDTDKAAEKKRGFECKFCGTRKSRQWRRAPGTAPGTLIPSDPAAKNSKDKTGWLTLALCGKCAYLWRRYAIQYESIEEVSRKIAAAGGRASKRKIDEELMRTILEAQNESGDTISATTAAAAASAGVPVPASMIETAEPPKKKPKQDVTPDVQAEPAPEKKKTVSEKAPEPTPLVPEMPRVKIHPCAVCHLIELPGDELLKCRDCRLHVHRSCYGVHHDTKSKGWLCDMCHNDHNTQVSTVYECVLCPVKYTAQELMEPLKVSHKKKSDREREKERLEREMVQEAGRRWRQEQEAAGRPVNPREALKRTAWNNWVHVICAMWTEEIKFGNAELFDAAEGVGFIPRERYEAECKICNTQGQKPTVACFRKGCPNRFHVGCAHAAEYWFGFDIFVPKGTRRDAKPMMRLEGEKGSEFGHATPIIMCPSHLPERVIHSMLEATDEGLTALQLYARLYKQADQSVTGTVRRAAQFAYNTASEGANSLRPGDNLTEPATQETSRSSIEDFGNRNDMISSPASPGPSGPVRIASEADVHSVKSTSGATNKSTPRKCCNCFVDVSPRWWAVERPGSRPAKAASGPNGVVMVNEHSGPPWRQGSSTSAEGLRTGPGSPQLSRTRQDELGPRGESSTPNGIIKLEDSPSGRMQDASANDAGEVMHQCHKCHKQGLPPPSSTSYSRTPRPPPGQDMTESEPPFYSAPPGSQPPFSAWSTPRPEAQHHTHPAMPPAQYGWPSGPPSHTLPQQSSSWSPGPRHSMSGPPPPPAPPPPGPQYHQVPPPHPDYYTRPPHYSSPYSTVPPPPPPRGQPNGISPHQPLPASYGYPHSHGLPPPPPPPLPPPPSHPHYSHPPHPPRYGSHPLPEYQGQPGPVDPPRPYGPPPQQEHHGYRSHSRGPSMDSTQQRSYSTVPPPPVQRSYGVPAPPAPAAATSPSSTVQAPPVTAGSPNGGPSMVSAQSLNLSQIAQSAAEQMKDHPTPGGAGTASSQLPASAPATSHVRVASTDSVPAAPSTPSASIDRERERGTDGDRGVVGASASPSLRNLLIS